MRIFSGIQPTGKLHIGNYFGAIENMLKLQKENEAIFSIVDLHALTVDYDPKELPKKIQATLLDFLACGIDLKKSIVFIQSHVKEHAELANLLQNIVPLGELERMTQFKEKAQKQASIKAGLLMYPVLMAADILLYDADMVPVGEDQKQHLELTKNIVRRFNNKFGSVLKDPNVQIPKQGARIMSLTSPQKKMSKSEPAGCLLITDSSKEIETKIKKAVTDSERKLSFDPHKRPGLSNLINIYSLTEKKEIKDLELNKFQGHNDLKKALIESLIKKFSSVRQRREKLEKQNELVKSIYQEGSQKAQKIASQKILQIKKAMGII
jgi:tryptophanyl-tRNA synthetase